MKKEIIKVSLVIITFCMVVDCTPDILGHEDNPVDTLIKPENPPQNFSVSGCKSTTRGLFENETIEYEACLDRVEYLWGQALDRWCF